MAPGEAQDGKRKAQEIDREVNLESILETAKEAALAAGAVVNGVWDQTSDIKDTKSNQCDLVTETDQKCEEIITAIIKARYPDHAIIGEEAVGDGKYELTDAPTWTVDPIDGTTNFVHRIPATCVLISFCLDKQPVVAVTYDPINDEMYYATKGGGAYLKSRRLDQPKRISVSGSDEVCRSVVGLESGYGRDGSTIKKLNGAISGLMNKGVRSLRMGGACGLNITNVASGRWDAFFEEGCWTANAGPKIWDFSGGKLIIEEAGGVMLDLTGSPFDLMGRTVFCAANQKLADEIVQMMKDRAL